MNVYGDGVRGHGIGSGGDIGDAVWQALGGRQGIRGNSSRCSRRCRRRYCGSMCRRKVAGGGDVGELIVGGAVAIRVGTNRGRIALAGEGRGRLYLGGLPVGQRDAGDLRLQGDGSDVGVLRAVAEAVAVVTSRIAHTTGDGNSSRKGQAKQTNKRQEPPHESSPLRAVEPRNGRYEHVKKNELLPSLFLLRVGPQQVDRTQARDPRRHTAARGRRGETHTEYSKKKVYQGGPTSGIEPGCPPRAIAFQNSSSSR